MRGEEHAPADEEKCHVSLHPGLKSGTTRSRELERNGIGRVEHWSFLSWSANLRGRPGGIGCFEKSEARASDRKSGLY